MFADSGEERFRSGEEEWEIAEAVEHIQWHA